MTYPIIVRTVATEQASIAHDKGSVPRIMRRFLAWETLCHWHGVPVGTRYLACPLLGEPLDIYDADQWDAEHAIPEAMGGRSTRGNIIAACTDCNLAKGDDTYLPHYVAAVQAASAMGRDFRGSDAVSAMRTLGIRGSVGTRSTLSPAERIMVRARMTQIWG